jgi:WbqC-like protein
MKVTISQPRYLPAMNYLQRIAFSDVFVVYDIVQRQARAWENRNKLLMPTPKWLTIPIKSSSRALIQDTKIDGSEWLDDHKSQIIFNYQHAPYFDKELLDVYYLSFGICNDLEVMSFSEFAISAITRLFDMLSIPHNFRFASEFSEENVLLAKGVDKLRLICEQLGAGVYISGVNGKDYGVVESFHRSDCVALFHCEKPQQYMQFNSPEEYVPYMGFFDALFNNGREWFRNSIMTSPNLIS